MKTPNRSRPHTTTTTRAGRRSVRSDHKAPRRSPELIADAVTASYIHDISQRSRRSIRAPKGAAVGHFRPAG
jgi:hypothetical protein